MKELLFKQFEREVKEASKEKIDMVVERIDSLIESVNKNSLKMSVLNIKITFDNIIMDGNDYKQMNTIREELYKKYIDVEVFKNGLSEFKNALLNKNDKVKSKDVESKVKFTEVQDNVEPKIITEDGPISEEVIQLINNIKDCIGTELFTEENFDERINKLHKSGLLTKIVLQNKGFKIAIAKEAGLDEVTDEEIIEFLSTVLGFRLVKKGLQIKQLNYIIELIKESDECLENDKQQENNSAEDNKEEIIESNANFTDVENESEQKEQVVGENNIEHEETVVSNDKPLMQQIIEKCNQDADKIAKDLQEAEQIFRNTQNNNIETVVEDVISTEIVKSEVVPEEIVKPDLDEIIKQEDPAKSFKDRNLCQFEGCTNKKHTAGYCAKHYKQLKEEGQI